MRNVIPYLNSNLNNVRQVNIKEVVELRDAIVQSGGDLRAPTNLTRKMKAVTRDKEVSQSLFQMLSMRAVVSGAQQNGVGG